MPLCNNCHKDFPNRIKLNGITRNISNRKYCLDCSPFGQHNTRQMHISSKMPETKECRRCSIIKPKEEFYLRRSKTELTPYCIICHNRQSIERQQKLKRECVIYKGGKCQVCGYNRYDGALEFHHINPEHKDFEISKISRTSFSEQIKTELDKCILLCSVCHKEEHARQRGLINW